MMDYLLNIVGDEAKAFAVVPSDQRAEVIKRRAAVAAVMNAPFGRKATACAFAAAELKVSTATVGRWVALYKRDGWRALLDHRIPVPSLPSN